MSHLTQRSTLELPWSSNKPTSKRTRVMNSYTGWYISGCGLTIHRQATPPVEAVTVLADDCLQKPHLHELHKHHMCGGGDGLAGSGCLNVSTSALPVSAQLPLSRPYNNDTSCSTKKVKQWSLIKTSLQRNCTTKVQLVEILLPAHIFGSL